MEVVSPEFAWEVPEDGERFLIELEFVQNLANLRYLHFLAQGRYFEDTAFLNFLRYLRYWKRPQYLVNILYPQCLAFLDALIDNPRFRQELAIPHFIDYCHHQQGLHWLKDLDTQGP